MPGYTIHWDTPQMPAVARAGQGQGWELGTLFRCPHGLQQLKLLSHHQPESGAGAQIKAILTWGWVSQPRLITGPTKQSSGTEGVLSLFISSHHIVTPSSAEHTSAYAHAHTPTGVLLSLLTVKSPSLMAHHDHLAMAIHVRVLFLSFMHCR